ncbi:hypothetical protein [Kitasatospora purpeofusca]|uniref:hypothetical protein n=1 Tax=Kitasatospora purpeofusca TaxID=67352 RepID=UPI003827EF65
MADLVEVGGTGEGCTVCGNLTHYATDQAAIDHLKTHSTEQLAFTLLNGRAMLQRFIVEVLDEGGVTSEEELNDLLTEVIMTASASPLRPPGIDL